MKPEYVSTAILLIITLLVCGAGYYVTEIMQEEEMVAVEDAIKLARMEKAEVEQLLVEESTTGSMATEAVGKWKARYKYIPEEMTTPDIVNYLEDLTARGFEAFNISLTGITPKKNFKQYTFEVDGTGYYNNLYDFVWHIENNRAFYRISNLNMSYAAVSDMNNSTGVERRLDMVNFSFTLDAYFDGAEGLSAEEDELIEVPEELLPEHDPAHNSFYPHVRTDLPSNDELLVNIESARLLSVIGGRAVVEDARGQHVLSLGDRVYLGTIVTIDPVGVRVIARLNKGGVMQEVELRLDAPHTEAYRQAQGNAQISPIRNQR
ncbi:MAG: hypothetical protein HKN17_04215 [Rhodothermales bacterium]|nr:hypothetical protein [Rhodothermales bacterium]